MRVLVGCKRVIDYAVKVRLNSQVILAAGGITNFSLPYLLI